MSAKFYRVLASTFGVIALVLLALLAYYQLQLSHLNWEVRFANDIVWSMETDRDRALKASVPDAADILWQVYFPSLTWPGSPELFHGTVAHFVDRQRQRAVRDVITFLRTKTAEDLGADPEPWILKYGSEQARDGLAAMKEANIRAATPGLSNKTVPRTGASAVSSKSC